MGREKQTEPTEVGGLECDREEFGGLEGNSIDILGDFYDNFGAIFIWQYRATRQKVAQEMEGK